MKVKQKSEKVGLKLSGLITSWQIDGETVETVTDFIFWAPKSLQMVTAAMKLRDQVANIHRIIEKAREFQKNIYFCFIDYTKVSDCVDHNKLENSSRDGNARSPYLPLEKPVCRAESNS